MEHLRIGNLTGIFLEHFGLEHGVSRRNVPFPYFDVTKIISEEMVPVLKDSN